MTREEYAELLDKAAEICVTKHAGQRDKAGTAYFLHPMRVAMRCRTDEERIVAMLHDTVEDTDARAKANPIGRMVKVHDLKDNLDTLRLNEVDEHIIAEMTAK